MSEPETQILMSLPPATARYLRQGGAAECAAVPESLKSPNVFVSHDPEGRPLGSGGGTVHLLAEAYAAEGGSESLEAWLAARQRLILHAGGLSRRLPAYSSAGKAMIPIPTTRLFPIVSAKIAPKSYS